ncbi:hypothetical protein J3F83DRAFT_37360 [Trichoderma novae-zelandiae]
MLLSCPPYLTYHAKCRMHASPCLSCQHIAAGRLAQTWHLLGSLRPHAAALLLDASLSLVPCPSATRLRGPGYRMNDSGRVAAALGLAQCHARHRSGRPATDTAISTFSLLLRSSNTHVWSTTVHTNNMHISWQLAAKQTAALPPPTNIQTNSRRREPPYQIMAVIIQHMQQTQIDPNTTPSMPPFDLPACRGYVCVCVCCIGTRPARSDDSDPHI